MSAIEPVSAIRTFGLNPNTYTAILSPIDANYYIIIGSSDGSAMRRSSDQTDPNSYLMPPSSWYSFFPPPPGRVARFPAGTAVTYLKASAGTPNAIVEFSQ